MRASAPALLALVLVDAVVPVSAFDLQGHRGARGLAPENTLAGFEHALRVGVSTLEMDVGVSRDGVIVVHHDPALDPDHARAPDGEWIEAPGPLLRRLTLAELRRYDVGRLRPGSDDAAHFPAQRPVDGERIPTLEEVVALAERVGASHVRFNVETKLDPEAPHETVPATFFADALVATIRRAGVAQRTTVQSFDWRTLRRIRERAPAIRIACLTVRAQWRDNVRVGQSGPSPWTAGLDVDDHGGSVPRLVAAAGADTWSPSHHDVDAAGIAEAHHLGLRVVPWTVNDPARMRELVHLGVDGLITDHPDRLREVLADLAIPRPPRIPPRPERP